MKHIGLFSGFGGFEIAAQWMGWETVAWCENNDFCRKILSYYFPNSYKLGDIRNECFKRFKGIDILTGGFPCQPFSVAGQRHGTNDDRFLWPEMYRAIKESSPRWVVAENVRGLLSIQSGSVFEKMCTDMEDIGYEILPIIIPAASVNAPHKRERLWIIAHSTDSGIKNMSGWKDEICKSEMFTNSTVERQWREGNGIGETGFINEKIPKNDWENFPTQSPICSGNDGISSKLDGITFSKFRKESIKGFGNAVVPNIPYDLFKSIEYIDSILF